MRGFIEEHSFLVEREYWEGVERADERFHRRIVLASHNPMLVQAYERSKVKLRISLSPTTALHETESTLPHHHAILRAIEARNPEEARSLLWNHLMKEESQ